MLVLAAAQLFVSVSAVAFHRGAAPALAATYAEAGVRLSPLTSFALESRLLPTVALAAGMFSLAALLARRAKRGPRLRVQGVALVVSGLAFMAAAVAGVWPLSGG